MTPLVPSGPSNGDFRQEHTYSTIAFDMNQDDLYYRFDWGDDHISDWIGPYVNGEVASLSHKWEVKGNYEVKAQVIDDPNGDGDLSDGVESGWSEPQSVSMPKFIFNSPLINRFLIRILGILPIFDFFQDIHNK